VRSALAVGVLATALLTTSCGEARERAATSDSGPAPKLEGAHIRGPIPGEQVDGTYRDEKGRAVDDVHRLLVIGNGEHRAVLLLGRRGERPCVAAVPAEKAEDAPLDCLESFENPPLVIRLVVGGETPRQTGWLAVLGIARAPTARVELDRQTAPLRAPLTTRSWPGFEWWGFGAMTERGNLGNQFGAFDAGGEPVISLDLGFSYNPPCLRSDEDVCGPKTPDKTWAESRDPVGALSGTGKEDFGTAFAHPAVRRLLAGHRFFVDGADLWQRCNGSTLGSIVSLRIWPRVSFTGNVPYREYAKPGENVSYREGSAYVEAGGIASVWIWVDHARERVVGIEVDAFDDTALDEQPPQVRVRKFNVIHKPVPAGGPDDASQCPDPGD
jgi:hypothetical protein